MIAAAVDASALVAILNDEPEADTFLAAMAGQHVIVGAPNLLEARIWCLRRSSNPHSIWLRAWAERPTTKVIAFDQQLEAIAADAYQRFGRNFHDANLNFGDAMAYAVAVHHGAPLLFKGGDFGRTDVLVHPASVMLN